MAPKSPHPIPDLSRRGVLRGVAVGGMSVPLLAACGGEETTGPSTETSSPSPTAAEPVSVPAADVPVGGGTILPDDLVVVTQPSEGEFKAFTAICTHQKCPVTEIADGEIKCPCHGSRYSIEDGSVVGGPAPAPLEEFSIAQEGDNLVVG